MEPYVHLLWTKARLCWIWKADGMLGPGVLPPWLLEAQAPFHAGLSSEFDFLTGAFQREQNVTYMTSCSGLTLFSTVLVILISGWFSNIVFSLNPIIHYMFHGPLNTPSSFPTLLFLGLASTPPSSWALPPSSLSSPFNISFANLLKTWAHTMSPGIQAILRVSVIHDSTAHLRTQIDKERPKLVSKDRLLFFYGYLLSHSSLSQALSQSITWLYLNYMIFCNLCI